VHVVLTATVARGVEAGRIRTDVSPARLARLLMSMAITAIHVTEIEGSADRGEALPEDVWTFCLQGMAAADPAELLLPASLPASLTAPVG
jgi:LDH2 family malate/lactate/ureidoglycolate dehydrogenase